MIIKTFHRHLLIITIYRLYGLGPGKSSVALCLYSGVEITTQIFYTYSGYFLVSNPGQLSNSANFIILLFGLVSLLLNYTADYQKESFKVRDQCSVVQFRVILTCNS